MCGPTLPLATADYDNIAFPAMWLARAAEQFVVVHRGPRTEDSGFIRNMAQAYRYHVYHYKKTTEYAMELCQHARSSMSKIEVVMKVLSTS